VWPTGSTARRPLARLLAALGALVLVAGGLGLTWVKYAPRRVPQGQPPLAALDLSSLPSFRDAFNGRAEEVRVLALLSPT
jgi:hypothetical protein